MATTAEPIASSSSPPRKYTFNSSSILNLSSARAQCTRLPDLANIDGLQHRLTLPSKRKVAAAGLTADGRSQDGPTSVSDARHGMLFLSYMQESDDSAAGLGLCNDVDYDPCPPWDFHYTNGLVSSEAIKKMEAVRSKTLGWPRPPPDFRGNRQPARPLQGHVRRCDCGDGEDGLEQCDARRCQCQEMALQLDPERYTTKELSGRFAYDSEGRLAADGALAYPNLVILECTDACGCDQDCPNRVVQRGRQVPLELFKTKHVGWGIRTRKALKPGTFITVYAGEILTNNEAEVRSLVYDEKLRTTYVNDIEPYVLEYFDKKKSLQQAHDPREIPPGVSPTTRDDLSFLLDNDRHYSLDAGHFGNFSRFFNHSCDPNMQIYHVYTDSVFDVARPWLAFFTQREVAEGEELTFSYSAQPDDLDEDHAAAVEEMERGDTEEALVKRGGETLFAKKCRCGATNCIGMIWRVEKPAAVVSDGNSSGTGSGSTNAPVPPHASPPRKTITKAPLAQSSSPSQPRRTPHQTPRMTTTMPSARQYEDPAFRRYNSVLDAIVIDDDEDDEDDG